ncbi:MAG: hypothetical protein QMD20_02060 [Candidatus Bathyarchaeia archaeon]|nr:hypothetical protein [Candidatus Bathyarchaeia archaeon]
MPAGQGELIFSDFYDKAPPWIRKVPSSKDQTVSTTFLEELRENL